MRKSLYKIGDKIGTHIITGTVRHKTRTNYLVKCEKCNIESERTSTQLKNRNKCRKCNVMSLINKKNNKTTFVEYIGNKEFNCICDCGKKFVGRERSKSCGCHIRENKIIKSKEMEGVKNGAIKIIRFSHMEKKTNGTSGAVYEAKCKCGKKFLINRNSILRIKSCGCRINANMAFGERQGNSKYKEVDVLSVRELFLTGQYSKNELSEMFNFPISAINDFIMNKSWKYLKVDKEILKNSPVKHKFNKRINPILPGQIYGKWTVLNKVDSKKGHSYYLCKCACGDQYEVLASALRTGRSTKCYWCNSKNFADLKRKKNVNQPII